MIIADAEVFREELEAELRLQSSVAVDLLIVPDIAEWAKGRCDNARGNPIAMAIVDQDSGGWGVLLRRSINERQVASVIDRIEWSGRIDASTLLNTPIRFLRHTVLHELAHLANNWGQEREDECDEWAAELLQRSVSRFK